MDNNGFNDVRLFYTKTGSAKYISHLDVMRAFQRSFRRARIPVWYTEGFHPHLYLTFALPLSLGYESMCESVDFRLVEDISFTELEDRLRGSLPSGFGVISVRTPEMPASAIKTAVYDISFTVGCSDPGEVKKAWETCFSQPEINVRKRTKRGDKIVDIKPLIDLSELCEENRGFRCEMKLAAGSEMNINPSLVFEAFSMSSGMKTADPLVVRTAVLSEDGKNFR